MKAHRQPLSEDKKEAGKKIKKIKKLHKKNVKESLLRRSNYGHSRRVLHFRFFLMFGLVLEAFLVADHGRRLEGNEIGICRGKGGEKGYP